MSTHIEWTTAKHTAITYRADSPDAAVLKLTDRFSGDGFGVEGTPDEIRVLIDNIRAVLTGDDRS